MPYYPPPSGGGGAGTVIVTTPSGVPSIAADTIQFPNGLVTDLGSGDASIASVLAGTIGCRVRNSGSVALTNGSDTVITFDSERFDTDGFHSTSSDTGRITIPAGMGGKYLIGANTDVTTSPGAGSYCGIRLNGTTYIATGQVTNDPSYATAQCGTVYDLSAGDYIEFLVHVNAGSKNALAAGNYSPEFWVIKLDSGQAGHGIGAVAYAAATQSIASDSWVAVTLGSEEYDSDGFHSTASNTSRFTIPAGLGGLYLLTGAVFMVAPGGGPEVAFRLNGSSTVRGAAPIVSPPGSSDGWCTISVVAALAAGDYVELSVYQASGSSKTVGHASYGDAQCRASVVRLDVGSSSSGLTFASLSPAADTYIAQDASSTNYATDTVVNIADKVESPGGYTKEILMEFDLAALSGRSVANAVLNLYNLGSGGNAGIFSGPIGIKKVIRSGVVLSQATWTNYATGNAWGTAGARNSSDCRHWWPAVLYWANAGNDAAGWLSWDLTGIVQQALAAGETTLQLLIGCISVATGSQNALSFASVNHGTSSLRPYMTVAYQ